MVATTALKVGKSWLEWEADIESKTAKWCGKMRKVLSIKHCERFDGSAQIKRDLWRAFRVCLQMDRNGRAERQATAPAESLHYRLQQAHVKAIPIQSNAAVAVVGLV